MELENVQSLLQDAGIEVDLKTLQNPTEEFMINLVTEYMKKFHFDGDEIAKPSPEQLDCVSCEDSVVNAIKAINLHAALATICDGIFLKDLTLTDITSPGCKKACKRIKVLLNFFVYVRNKMVEQESTFCELENRHKEIQDMIEKQAEFIAKIGSVIHEREIKLEFKDKVKKEIKDLKLLVEKDEKVRSKLQKRVQEVTAKQQGDLDKCNALKAKAHELHKVNKDLQSKIVKSPEEYMTRKKDLKNMLEEKMEERQRLKDCINRKKRQIQNNELAESEVKKFNSTTNQVGEIMQKLKKAGLQIDATKNQLDKVKKDIFLLENKPSNLKNDSSSTDTVELEISQRRLSDLHKSLAEKQSEYDSIKIKLEELRSEQRNINLTLQTEKETILVAESEYDNLLKSFKSYYENEISEEITLDKNLKQLSK